MDKRIMARQAMGKGWERKKQKTINGIGTTTVNKQFVN